jgi:hypothetical protein
MVPVEPRKDFERAHHAARSPAARRLVVALAAMTTVNSFLATAASAQTPTAAQTMSTAAAATTTTTTKPVVTLPGAGTTTTTTGPKAPAATTTTEPRTSTTSRAAGAGVPAVPVAGPPTPPTTAPPAGTPVTVPAQPDVAPAVSQVDSDLAQLQAIDEYKPAQALVATAQGKVTIAGAALLSARQDVQRAQSVAATAATLKAGADSQLRQLALAAYVGVTFTNPEAGPPADNPGPSSSAEAGNGVKTGQGSPFGLSGMDAVDAKELLLLVGERAKLDADDAAQHVAQTAQQLTAAKNALAQDQTAVAAAENGLINAQQTLKTVALDATTPGAATAGALPSLQLDDSAQPATSSTTAAGTTTNPGGFSSAAVQAPVEDINGAPAVSPDIISAPALDAQQMQAWWGTLNRQPNVTVPIDNLIQSYYTWGTKLGVRADIAFAQSIVETGYFSFPSYGQLTSKDNNFAGIGACDTCATGWSFPTADTGVEAQLELLREYATTAALPAGVQNVIGSTGVGGCCQTWVQLAGKWASSTTYGIAIMTIYQSMLQWFIPQEELAQGLLNPTTTSSAAAAQGPELAPLPAPPTTTTTSTTVAARPAATHAR